MNIFNATLLQLTTYLLKGILFITFLLFIGLYIPYELTKIFLRKLNVHLQTKSMAAR